MGVMLQALIESAFYHFMKEQWLQLVVVFFQGEHLFEKFCDPKAKGFLLEMCGIAYRPKLLFIKVLSKFFDANECLNNCIHVTVLAGVVQPDHSRITVEK
jgi:hypothetical protein